MPKKAENNDKKISSKKQVIEDYESETESSDFDSVDAISIPKRKNKLKKPIEKKPYVMTDARKLAFARAQEKRQENIKINKELKDKEQQHIKMLKEQEKLKKQKKISKLESKLQQISESEEEEIIIKKKKPKNKVVYVDESDDDNDRNKKNVIIINNGKEPDKKQLPRRSYREFFV